MSVAQIRKELQKFNREDKYMFIVTINGGPDKNHQYAKTIV